jgi:hypothetical protein
MQRDAHICLNWLLDPASLLLGERHEELATTSSTDTFGPRLLSLPVTTPYLAPLKALKAPVMFYDIYVNDYMSLAQGTARWHTQHRQAPLLNSLDEVFHPEDAVTVNKALTKLICTSVLRLVDQLCVAFKFFNVCYHFNCLFVIRLQNKPQKP